MKKILILAMMTLLFAVTALSTTAGNFFWVTSTFGTPTSLFSNSQGGGTGGGPNPNVNPPFPSSGDPTDWAVFATEGKYSLSGSAFIKPKNESSPSGYMGTNASSLVGGVKPVDFGSSEDSVILPPSRFYFGPGANPSELVAGGNLGPQSIAQIADFKANSKVLKTTKSFFDPKTIVLSFPSAPTFPDIPENLPSKGSTETSWSHQTIRITESGHYTSINTGWGYSLEFIVGEEDLVVQADSMITNGAITVTRTGNGDFFLFCGNGNLNSNDSVFSVDIGNAHTVFNFTSLTIQNKLNLINVQSDGSFSLKANTITINNSVSALMVNAADLILRFGSLTMSGSTVWTIERVGENTGEVFVFVDSALNLSSNTKLIAKDGSNEFIHLIYKGSPANFSFSQFQLNGSIYALNAVNITVSGSSSVKNLVTKGNITVSGAGTAANSVYTPEGNVTITGSGNLKNGAMAGGNSVELSGGIEPPKYIWAPNAQVSLSGSANVEGRVIGKNIALSGSSKIFYEMVDYELPEIPAPNRNVNEPSLITSGDPTDWVVFSVGGIIKFGGVKVNGLTGTNATTTVNGSKPVSGVNWDTISNPGTNFYIGGPGAIPSNVVTLPSAWNLTYDAVKKLSKRLDFPIPEALANLSFSAATNEALKVTAKRADIRNATTIVQSGVYDLIWSGSNQVTINVADADIVLRIGTLKASKILVNRTGTGRVFLFVNTEFNFSGAADWLRTVDEEDDYVFLFYLGYNQNFKFSGAAEFYGCIYAAGNSNGTTLLKSTIDISGSGKIKDVVSMSNRVTLTGSAEVGTIYCKNCTVVDISGSDTDGKLGGVITGGIELIVTGSRNIDYIYAPLASIDTAGSGTIGMIIGYKLETLGASKLVTGPSYLPMSNTKPIVPVPIVP